MYKHYLRSLAVLLSMGLLTGCGSSGSNSSSSSDSASAAAPASEPATRPIPPDSPFAKVRMNEHMDEVVASIGQPTSIESYQTGKAWIPFHFGGGDVARQRLHYKGIGTIICSNDSAYTSGWSVIEIDYDPDEPGFAK